MDNQIKKEVISILVDNQANVLTRVISLFGRRGFNIDSLTVSTTNDPKLSRITARERNRHSTRSFRRQPSWK